MTQDYETKTAPYKDVFQVLYSDEITEEKYDEKLKEVYTMLSRDAKVGSVDKIRISRRLTNDKPKEAFEYLQDVLES